MNKIIGMIICASVFSFTPLTLYASNSRLEEIYNLMGEGEFNQVLREVTALLINDAENEELLRLLSEVQTAMGNLEEASMIFERIIRLNPLNYNALINTARRRSWAGEYEKAVEYYEMAHQSRSSEVAPLLEKARVIGWSVDKERALKAYDEAYEIFPYDWIKYERDGKSALWSGRPRRAFNYFSQSLKENPDNQEVLSDTARLHSDIGDYAKAEEYYEKLISLNPYLEEAREAREKNKRMMRGVRLNASVGYWDALSSERNTDIKLLSPGISSLFQSKDEPESRVMLLF